MPGARYIALVRVDCTFQNYEYFPCYYYTTGQLIGVSLIIPILLMWLNFGTQYVVNTILSASVVTNYPSTFLTDTFGTWELIIVVLTFFTYSYFHLLTFFCSFPSLFFSVSTYSIQMSSFLMCIGGFIGMYWAWKCGHPKRYVCK